MLVPAVGPEAVVDLVPQGGTVEAGVPTQGGGQVQQVPPSKPEGVGPLLQGLLLLEGPQLPDPVPPCWQPDSLAVSHQGISYHCSPGREEDGQGSNG